MAKGGEKFREFLNVALPIVIIGIILVLLFFIYQSNNSSSNNLGNTEKNSDTSSEGLSKVDNGLCNYNNGENCQNTPSKCICKNGQFCFPSRPKADNLGCYTPVCGDGYTDYGETSDNCCMDAGCPGNLVCDANLKTCVKPQCPYDCCENDLDYQDKSCPEYYSCNSQKHSCNPIDSDNDSSPDYKEIQLGTDLHNPDSDGDTVLDGYDNHPLSSYLPRTYSYNWYYGARFLGLFPKNFKFSITLSEDVVSSYENMPKTNLLSREDLQLKEVAQKMTDLANEQSYNDADKLMMVIAFSRSFNYDYTKASYINKPLPDWANFPMETIVKKQGLCADSAVMATALLRKMGYDAHYLVGPCWDKTLYHAVVGVALVDGITLDGTERYEDYNGKKYYYLDATSSDSAGNLFYSATSKDDFGKTFCSMNEFVVSEGY